MDARISHCEPPSFRSTRRSKSKTLMPQVKHQQAILLSCMLRSGLPNKFGRRATRSSGAAGSRRALQRR